MWLRWRYPKASVTLKSLAQSGTDSWYFASHLDRLPKNADLVLVDYVTNDLSDKVAGDATEHSMRAVTEKIIRAALSLPRKPTVILLGLLRMPHLMTAAHHAYQDAVYAHVADAYDVTLVSYRDAIWPEFSQKPNPALYETTSPPHPTWVIHCEEIKNGSRRRCCTTWMVRGCPPTFLSPTLWLIFMQVIHQLIADCLVHAVSVAAGSTPLPIPPSSLFLDEAVEALDACRKPLTHYVGDGLRAAAAAPGDGWYWWDLRKTKEGWEYDDEKVAASKWRRLGIKNGPRAPRSRDAALRLKALAARAGQRRPATATARVTAPVTVTPAAAAAAAIGLRRAPLTFWMNFSATPALLVTHARGAGDYWLDQFARRSSCVHATRAQVSPELRALRGRRGIDRKNRARGGRARERAASISQNLRTPHQDWHVPFRQALLDAFSGNAAGPVGLRRSLDGPLEPGIRLAVSQALASGARPVSRNHPGFCGPRPLRSARCDARPPEGHGGVRRRARVCGADTVQAHGA